MEGSGPAVTAVLGGHISFTTSELGVVHKYLQAGSLRALAVWAAKRHKDLPNVPTTVERGFTKLILPSWQSFNVPLKTPQDIVEKLEKSFKELLNDKEIIERLEKAGWVMENLGSKGARNL
jgi:tripartite-type tricarboxylate transporter receptor subunit TctC